ncbi:Ribose methyltransferase [Coemansia sp. RSA 1813]|nr:Ribose methyltransferase [Coemansia sp. RSA 1646]KAJ1771904.1 Ribose methyltransferase [Coemansia sp. RSA 1843]KAJ2088626.1 Ribose methyltransferase [Coemansia sp. RSA 986]KAJ2211132.1 Ribose methyltransferase [Coemansia sp. RSA 487]KAJ2568352.1 Ribose methyltransferase [Coemansia sp. RSA 1813]
MISADLPNSELLYGVAPVMAALKKGSREVYELYYRSNNIGDVFHGKVDEIFSMAKQQGVPIKHVSKETLVRAVDGNIHQGIVLKVSKIKDHTLLRFGQFKDGQYAIHTSEDMFVYESRRRYPLWVCLDRIQDQYNLGSIMRSALFFGADGIVIDYKEGCRPTPHVCKASAGAREYIPCFNSRNIVDLLSQAKQDGWKVISTSTRDAENGESATPGCLASLDSPAIVVLGNEGFGVREQIVSNSSVSVHIPVRADTPEMFDSLNVGVAAAIALSAIKFTGE